MTALKEQYGGRRCLTVEASVNGEVMVKVDSQDPMFFDAEDLLSAVAVEAVTALPSLGPKRRPS